jgi:hypothetical protein
MAARLMQEKRAQMIEAPAKIIAAVAYGGTRQGRNAAQYHTRGMACCM